MYFYVQSDPQKKPNPRVAHWAATPRRQQSEIRTDWYGGWAPFAVDDGGIYQAENAERRIADWASLGFKPGAPLAPTTYVNGCVRGEWNELTVSGAASPTGEIMLLLQGQSTQPVNANVYFDDV